MKTSTIKMLSGLALGAGLAFTATTAHADNYRRYFVPDYDQVRGAIFDIEGLPNNGSMYCVPTAAMNIMSYIAQRGFPFVPPSTGDFGPDADTAAYNELTNWLEILGNEMGTSATGGTSGEGAEAGKAVLALSAQRLMVFGHSTLSGRPKGLNASIPLEQIQSIRVDQGKLAGKLVITFADGTSVDFDVVKTAGPVPFAQKFTELTGRQ